MDTSAERVASRYKAAAEPPNPLQDMNRSQAVKRLYKLIGRIPDGFFRDNSWRPIHQIFDVFRKNGVEYEITSTEYFKDDEGRPNAKMWKIEITFIGKSGRPQIIYGTITGAGAGSVDDPLSRYDVTVTLS